MSRKCSCFVIGVPRKFKEFNSVPRYTKGWEPLLYCLNAIAKNSLLVRFQDPFGFAAIGPVSDLLDAYNLVDYGGISGG